MDTEHCNRRHIVVVNFSPAFGGSLVLLREKELLIIAKKGDAQMDRFYVNDLIDAGEAQRNEHILAQPEGHHLFRRTSAWNNPHRFTAHRRLLASFGSWMVKWGNSLQERYDDLVMAGINPSNPPQTSDAPPC